jgi:predicted metal-dependent phosphoesterase TrpH
MTWTFLGHAHTKHSFDSLTEPRALVREARRLGADALAVTDHDTWRGAVDALAEVHASGGVPRIIVASEVHTDHGDLIGLFLKDDIRVHDALEFCDIVHDHGGLVLLPHPFRQHRLDDALLSRVDLIETYNARTSRAANLKAEELARARGLPALAGPDAHRVSELSLATVEFEGDLPADEAGLKHALLHAPRHFRTARGSIWDSWFSQGAHLLRRPSPAKAWYWMRGALRRVVMRGKYDLG